jgi:hypothetical protein
MKHVTAFLFALTLGAVLLADEPKCAPVALKEDPSLALEVRQDRLMADFEKLLPGSAAKPTLPGIRELKSKAYWVGVYENDSISDAFRLTGGHSVRSIPSSELSAHLDVIKSVKKVETLLEDAREAAEAHKDSMARSRLAAASREWALTRKLVAEKRKVRLAHASKAKAEGDGLSESSARKVEALPKAQAKPQPDAPSKKPEPKTKKSEADKSEKGAKPKKA